jgi:molybdopterin synthase catalytic subunit
MQMQLEAMIERVKQNPDFDKAGMLLCHNGVVRRTSRDGRRVKGLTVTVDPDKLAALITAQKKRAGIVDIQVTVASGRYLSVGEDVMLLVVAGDVRENVISVLKDTLDAIKSEVTHKTEYFDDDPTPGHEGKET